VLGIAWAPAAQAEETPPASPRIQIEQIDAAGYPERIWLSVLAQDEHGDVLQGLTLDDFVIKDQRAPVDALTIEREPEVLTIALVIDTHRGVEATMLSMIGNSTNALIDALPHNEGVFATTSPTSETTIIELLPIFPENSQFSQEILESTANRAISYQQIDTIAARITDTVADNSRSDLYGAIQTAVEQEPTSIVVLSNGLDRTQDQALLDAAAERAKERNIAIHVVGFVLEDGANDNPAPTALELLADDTGGSYRSFAVDATAPVPPEADEDKQQLADEDKQQLVELAQQISQAQSSSTYLLSYALRDTPAAQRERQLTIQLADDQQYAASATYTPLPPIDQTQPAFLNDAIVASGYPEVSVTLVPETAAHRALTPTSVLTDMIHITLDGIANPLTEYVSLHPEARVGAESIALVVDLRDIGVGGMPNDEEMLNSVPVHFIDTASTSQLGIQSRMALFANSTYTFSEGASPQVFDVHHNVIWNEALGVPEFRQALSGDMVAPLRTAIAATAADARQRGEPAHVILFSSTGLPIGVYDTLIQQAREARVTIHVVASRPVDDPRLASLAHGTGGIFVPNMPAPGTEMRSFQNQLAQVRPLSYTLEFLSPIVAAGQPLSITVGLSETTQTILHTARHDGPPIIDPPWPLIVLLLGVVWVGAGGWFVFFASTRPAGVPFWHPLLQLLNRSEKSSSPEAASDVLPPLEPTSLGPPLDRARLETTLAALAAYGHQQRKERSMGNDDDDGFWGPEIYQPARNPYTNTIEQSSFPER
jgi:hypothetical protein